MTLKEAEIIIEALIFASCPMRCKEISVPSDLKPSRSSENIRERHEQGALTSAQLEGITVLSQR